MSDTANDTGAARLGHPAGQGWERALFGHGSIGGTVRMVLYALLFVVVCGTLFYLA